MVLGIHSGSWNTSSVDKGEGGQLYFITTVVTWGMLVREDGLPEASSCLGEPYPVSVEVEIMLHMFSFGRFRGWDTTKVLK